MKSNVQTLVASLIFLLLGNGRHADASENNFLQSDGHEYRHLVCLWGSSPPNQNNWYQRRLLAFPLKRIFPETSLADLTPSQLRLIYFHNFDDKSGRPEAVPFSVIRGNAIVTPADVLKDDDVLLLRTPDIKGDGSRLERQRAH